MWTMNDRNQTHTIVVNVASRRIHHRRGLATPEACNLDQVTRRDVFPIEEYDNLVAKGYKPCKRCFRPSESQGG